MESATNLIETCTFYCCFQNTSKGYLFFVTHNYNGLINNSALHYCRECTMYNFVSLTVTDWQITQTHTTVLTATIIQCFPPG